MTRNETTASTNGIPSGTVPWRSIVPLMILLVAAFWLFNSMQKATGIAGDIGSVCKTAFLIYAPLIWIHRRKENLEDFGLRFDRLKSDITTTALLALATLPVFIVLYVVWYSMLLHKTVTAHLDWQYARGVVLMILIVGIPEEMFFRGWLQTLLSRRWGDSGPRLLGVRVGPDIVLTALLFACAHVLIKLNIGTAATFIPGLALGWIRKRTGSVFGAGLYHGLCNSTVLLFNPNLISQ